MKKIAIVTGGSRGIGFAIAQKLCEEGYAVVITARSTQEQNRLNLEKLSAANADWLFVQGDISVAADREKMLQKTLAKYGAVDVLINNAGVAPLARSDLLEMSEESFDRVVGINTKGTLFMSQLVAKQMLRQQGRGKNAARSLIFPPARRRCLPSTAANTVYPWQPPCWRTGWPGRAFLCMKCAPASLPRI